MKLKDFKDEPKKYEEIKALCKDMNIKVTDQSDVSDVLARVNAIGAISGFANKILSSR